MEKISKSKLIQTSLAGVYIGIMSYAIGFGLTTLLFRFKIGFVFGQIFGVALSYILTTQLLKLQMSRNRKVALMLGALLAVIVLGAALGFLGLYFTRLSISQQIR